MKKQYGCIVPISVILFIALVVSVLSFNKAEAQSTRNPCFYAVSPSATDGCTSVSTSKPLPVTASISGFAPATTGTPISVTTGGVSGTLPLGTVVVATNVGTTNAAYCKLGASATVSDQYISPNGGWFAFTVGAATQLTCITSTSTTTVNMTGGSGIATGTGGGSGGSGGGDATAANQTAVQAPVAAAAASATKSNLVGGQYLASLPTMTNTQQGSVTFDVNGRLIVLEKNSADILTAVQGAIPAGTNVIGRVGIDQTSPGTTNAVSTTNWPTTVDTNSGNKSASTPRVVIATDQPNLATPLNVALAANQSVNTAQVNGVTTLTGTGATGTGAQRVTVSTDQATNAGAALVKGGVGTVNGGSDYETVAASQTAQALGATGATGDYLSHCVLQPTTTGAGTATILDNATVIFTFTTGTLSNLAPIAIPIGAISVSGAWKVTTGANETMTCFGKFT